MHVPTLLRNISGFEIRHFEKFGHFYLSCGGPIGLKFAPDLRFMILRALSEAFLKILILAIMAAILNSKWPPLWILNGRHYG